MPVAAYARGRSGVRPSRLRSATRSRRSGPNVVTRARPRVKPLLETALFGPVGCHADGTAAARESMGAPLLASEPAGLARSVLRRPSKLGRRPSGFRSTLFRAVPTSEGLGISRVIPPTPLGRGWYIRAMTRIRGEGGTPRRIDSHSPLSVFGRGPLPAEPHDRRPTTNGSICSWTKSPVADSPSRTTPPTPDPSQVGNSQDWTARHKYLASIYILSCTMFSSIHLSYDEMYVPTRFRMIAAVCYVHGGRGPMMGSGAFVWQ